MLKILNFSFIVIIHWFVWIPSPLTAEPIRLDRLDSGEYIGKHIEYLNEKDVFAVVSKGWHVDSLFKERMLSGELHSSDIFQLQIEPTPTGYKAIFQKNAPPEVQQSVEWGIQDVIAPDLSSKFIPSDKSIFMLNFMPHSYWLRFNVLNDGPEERDLILEFDWHLFSVADLFIPTQDGAWIAKRGDFIQTLKMREIRTKTIAFNIQANSGMNTIHLRVDNRFIGFIPLRLWFKKDFNQYMTHDDSLLGIISGIFIFICIFNLFIFFSTRDQSYIYLSFMSICGLAEHLAYSGLGFQLLWPDNPVFGFSVLYVAFPLSYTTFLLFCRSFIDIPQVTIKTDRVIMIMIVSFTAVAISLIILPMSVKIWVFGIMAFLEHFYYLPILYPAILVTRQGNRAGLFLIVGICLFFLASVEWFLSSFDVLPFSMINYIHIKGVSFLIIMMLGLSHKINTMKKSLADLNVGLEYKVSQRTRELVQANEKLKELDQLKSIFFANVSHELRTPLTLISAPVKSFIKGTYGPVSDKGASILLMMQRNLDRLLKLITNLLDYSKIEAGKMSAKRTNRDISALLLFCVSSVQTSAEEKEIDISFKDHTGGLMASIDSDLMEKAIFNLLSNAIKFTEPGGKIRVELKKNDGAMEIAVKDTGIGISQEQLKIVFERFAQVDSSSTRKYEGTGIGLSLTREIIQLHQGKIMVSSHPKKGSEFIVRLPIDIRTQSASVSAKKHAEIDGSPDAEHNDRHSGDTVTAAVESDCILIVEDNGDMREYLSTLLEDRYQILTAVNGKDALDKLGSQRADLILADIMMPEMDGYELIKTIRSNRSHSTTPVILISARSEMQDKVRGIELGANDYVVKPFNPEELLARIASQMKFKRLRMRFSKTGREKKSAGKSITEKTKTKIEAVKDFLLENFSDNISRDSLASAIEMSPDHLGRMFKEHTGEKISDYLNKIRVEEAKKRLLETEEKIITIAFDVGFGSLRSFNKVFLNLVGVSPSAFRKEI